MNVKRLLRFLVFCCSVVIALSILLIAIVSTESGSGWFVRWLIKTNEVPLRIEKIEGRLADSLLFHDIRYEDDGTTIRVAQLEIVWHPTALLDLTFDIESIRLAKLRYQSEAVKENASSDKIDLPVIKLPDLPVSVELRQLSITEAEIVSGQSAPLFINVDATGSLNEEGLFFTLNQLTVNEQVVTGRFNLRGAEKPELDLYVDGKGSFGNESFRALLELTGPQEALKLQVSVEGAIEMNAEGRFDLAMSPYAIALEGELQGQVMDTLTNGRLLNKPLSFSVTGNRNDLSLSAKTDATINNNNVLLNANAELALPGKKYDELALHLEWESNPENKSNSLLKLTGIGDVVLVDDRLEIDHLLEGPGRVRLAGSVFLEKYMLDLSLGWEQLTFPLGKSTSLSSRYGKTRLAGKLDELMLSLETVLLYAEISEEEHGPVESELQIDGRLNLLSDKPEFEVKGTLNQPVPASLIDTIPALGPINFKVNAKKETIALAIAASATAKDNDNYLLELNSEVQLNTVTNAVFDWSISPEDSEDIVVSGEGKFDYGNDKLMIEHHSLAPLQTSLQGQIILKEDSEPQLEFQLDWSQIDLSKSLASGFASEQGQLIIKGSSADLNIEATSRLEIDPVGPIGIRLLGKWKESILNLEQFAADLLNGEILASGVINMQEAMFGDIEVNAKNIDFSRINPDLQSSLGLDSIVAISEIDGERKINVNVSDISGSWRGKPVQGNANMTQLADVIDISQFQLELEKNKLDLTLRIGKTLSGSATLALTDLSGFSDELAGSIVGNLNIDGEKTMPGLKGELLGTNLYVNDVRMQTLDARIDVNLKPAHQSELEISISTFSYQDYSIDSLSLSGSGLTEQHTLSINATGKGTQLKGTLNGELLKQRWSGRLNELIILSPEFGEWRLPKPMAYAWQYDNDEFAIEDACLTKAPALICLQAKSDKNKQVAARLTLEQLPLGFVNQWLPATLTLEGKTSGLVNFNSDSQDWRLSMDLNASQAKLGVGFEEDVEYVDLASATLRGSASNDTRQLELLVSAPSYFELALQSQFSRSMEAPLSADLTLQIVDIGWLDKVEPALTGTSGAFVFHMQASGTKSRPRVDGEFRLQDGVLSILPLGLRLDEIQGHVSSDDANSLINLDSFVSSGDKRLEIKGNVNLDEDEAYPYLLTLNGTDFPVMRTADTTVNISPALTINGSTVLHKIRGTITIPLLDMLFASLPESAVSISKDVVIVQSKKPGAVHIEENETESDFVKNHLDIDINVILKPDIHIRGFGLDTRLTGDLKVTKPVGVSAPLGQGQITIEKGSYRAYGQNLLIEQGRLLFAGPLDNPSLNIRAYRPDLPVKAGVNVTGNIRQPKLTLYSEPAQTESDILSYIITGRPLSGASGGEASLIARAALSLGVRESSMLTGQIADMFNLDEFSVGAGDTVDSASLNASKKISKDLTFRTAFNPFDQLWTFLLNYKLTDYWSVQTESGATQGADIIYSIESNKFNDLYRKFLELLKF